MYVEREIADRFVKLSRVYNAVAVVGARQAGKTTFLKEQAKKLSSCYVTFDDPDARAFFEEDARKFERQYMQTCEVSILDEVQYCSDAGIKLKFFADKGRKMWLSSSSELLLGKEVLSYLVGRVSILRMYPFSIAEFLSARGQKEITGAILQRSVWEHMLYGGYPKVVLTEDVELKKTVLKDLFDTMVLKDVARTFSIDNIASLETFARYLALNVGSVISYESVSSDIGISFQSLKKYLDAMEKSYLIATVRPFFTNKLKELTKRPKVFYIDCGLRNVVAKATALDGHIFENYVFTELVKLGFTPKYWRTKSKAEVDFVVERNNSIIPVEAKLAAEPGRVPPSLKAFIEAYNPATALVITYKGAEGKAKVGRCTIFFVHILRAREILGSARQKHI